MDWRNIYATMDGVIFTGLMVCTVTLPVPWMVIKIRLMQKETPARVCHGKMSSVKGGRAFSTKISKLLPLFASLATREGNKYRSCHVRGRNSAGKTGFKGKAKLEKGVFLKGATANQEGRTGLFPLISQFLYIPINISCHAFFENCDEAPVSRRSPSLPWQLIQASSPTAQEIARPSSKPRKTRGRPLVIPFATEASGVWNSQSTETEMCNSWSSKEDPQRSADAGSPERCSGWCPEGEQKMPKPGYREVLLV